MMTSTLLTMTIFLLPILIAFSTRSVANDQMLLETALQSRRRLVWTAVALAAISLAYYLAIVTLVPAAGPPDQVTIYFVWVPWVLLVQYRYPALVSGSNTGIGHRRSASLRPRSFAKSVRTTWAIAAVVYVVGMIVVILLAWRQGRESLLTVLPLITLAGPTGMLYWLAKRAHREEPETYPGAVADPTLAGAYEQRRTLVSWAFVVLFVVQASVHLLFVANALGGRLSPPTLLLATAIAPSAAGVAYWLLRKRFDRRIETLLQRQPAGGAPQ